jgi:nucleotide-binding universal stress UspA family protein
MAAAGRFHVLIATDGSATARAALATAVRFPWPAGTSASAVTARQVRADYRSSVLLGAIDRNARLIRRHTARAMAKRWPDADVRILHAPPVDAILGDVRRVGADVVVMGWRGHGAVRRMLTGSVSRGVVRQAPCSVLVVRRSIRQVRHVVLGFDGSPYARRAVALMSACDVPRGAGLTLFTAVDRMHLPPQALAPPDVRRAISAEVARINKARMARAHADLDRATETLTAAGWQVNRLVGETPPLGDLLHAVATTRADLLVVGAKGAGALRHLLLGSVAEGALNHSPAPVLIAR